jgi:outer membrane receptor protein involved in Fe transport
MGPWTFMLNADRIGGGQWNPRFVYDDNSVEAVWYLDATVQAKVPFATSKDATVYLNISNLLDQEPPFGMGFQNGAYDRIGQTFKLGVRFSY